MFPLLLACYLLVGASFRRDEVSDVYADCATLEEAGLYLD